VLSAMLEEREVATAARLQPPRATLVPLSRRCHGFRRRRVERR
jgi:hypothetical protein